MIVLIFLILLLFLLIAKKRSMNTKSENLYLNFEGNSIEFFCERCKKWRNVTLDHHCRDCNKPKLQLTDAVHAKTLLDAIYFDIRKN